MNCLTTYHHVTVEELVELERFVGRDQAAAEEAFAKMSPRISRFLRSYLSTILPRAEDREDVILTSLMRLWQRRTGFEVKGRSAWWSYVAITGRRCALTLLGQPDNAELGDEIPDSEQYVVDAFAELAEDRRRMYRAADHLWLCTPQTLTPRERNERLLAAQLYYLDGLPWEEVAEILGLAPTTGRAQIDAWLASESTLLDLAYHRLFWENDALASYLLRPSSPLDHAELEEWTQAVESGISGACPDGRDWAEIAVIVWRFRYGMITEKIVQRAPGLPRARVEEILEDCQQLMPCEAVARQLQEKFAVAWVKEMPLENPDLWKRLVFQYFAKCELPQRQILERTQPAAEVAGRKITEGMLNVWLSNGRLFAQLAKHVQEVGA